MSTSGVKKPIRILQYIGGLDPGGSQSMIMNIYRNIDKKKIQFDFIIDRKNEKLYKDEIELLGGKVYIFDEFFRGYNYIRFTKQWKIFFTNHPEYKILHCHVRSVASIVFKIAKEFGLKTICHSHSTSNGKGMKAIVKKYLQGKIKNNCDYFFACSEESAKWLYGDEILKRNNCMIIKNAIDSSKYVFDEEVRKKVRTELGLKNNIIIGQVGRLEMVKNYVFSLELLSKIIVRDHSYRLLIVGSGSQKNYLINMSRKLNVFDYVVFLDKRDDINELLQAMDVFIMPSLYEGLPFALVEAQAACLPCLISDRIIDGILIKNLVTKISLNDQLEWIRKIESFSKLKLIREDNSNIIIKNGFDIVDSVDKISKFYLSLAKEGACC